MDNIILKLILLLLLLCIIFGYIYGIICKFSFLKTTLLFLIVLFLNILLIYKLKDDDKPNTNNESSRFNPLFITFGSFIIFLLFACII